MRASFSNIDIHEKTHKIRLNVLNLPPIGMRIIKTAIAVFLCLFVYVLRGYQGMVGESVVTTILCIQPSTSESRQTGIDRLIGTGIGGLWGLFFLNLLYKSPLFEEHMILTYFVIALGLILVIYSTVLLHLVNASALAAIVFACVVIAYPNISSPLLEAKDRMLDTAIGVLIGVFINSFSLPRDRKENRVFFVQFQDIAPDRYATLSSKISLILSYLYNRKAKICLMTGYAPAYLIPQVSNMNITMPCIVMDGAAIYDTRFNSYVRTIPIVSENAEMLENRFRELDLGYSVFTIRNDAMMIYRMGPLNLGEEEEYTLMRRTPYRNYIYGPYTADDQLLGIRLIVPNDQLEEIRQKVLTKNILEHFTVTEVIPQGLSGYTAFHFKNHLATYEAMEKQVMEYLHFPTHMEVFHMQLERPNREDTLSMPPTEHEALAVLGRIKKLYEPVSLLIDNGRFGSNIGM